MRRSVVTALAAAATWLAVAAPAAPAKEGVVAEVTPVPAGADPGERVTVAWTLTMVDDGVRRSFGAAEIYVRLESATGGAATRAWVSDVGHPPGRYTASVVVPEGGVGSIEIGIRGYVDGVPGDLAFPIVNDALVPGGDRGDGALDPPPATGQARRPSPATSERSPPGPAVAVAAGVAALLVAAAARLRRGRRASVRA
jgi:hypothetical protein